ncbi:hypothetical protein ACWIGI_19850 [Nocardia sp. NPDC055321]
MGLVQDIHHALYRFPDGVVLTAESAIGYPVSMRCHPGPRGDSWVLARPRWFDGVDGPATMLAHSHDADGWNLRSVRIRGTIRSEGIDIVFTPTGFEENTGSPAQALRTSRAAKDYLRRRGLARPKVPWARIKAARSEVTGRD